MFFYPGLEVGFFVTYTAYFLFGTLNAGLSTVLHLLDCLRAYSHQAKVEAKAKKDQILRQHSS